MYYPIAEVPMYIYVHLRYLFNTRTTENIFMLKLISVLLSPIVFLTIWTLKLAKGAVHLWLAYKGGDDFVQIVDSTDLIFLCQDTWKTRCVVTTLLQLEFDGDREEFGTKVKDEIATVFSAKRFLKLRCSVEQGLGYYYFKRAHWPINKHFIPLSNDCNNETMTLESLRKVISEIANAPMPCNDKALWEVRVGERLEGSGKSVYPFIFRFHHVVGDAVALFDMFSGEFQNRFPPSDVKVAPKKQLKSLETIFTKKPFINACGLIDMPDNNMLCQENGNKHIVWYTEEKPQIVNAIKEMKAKLNNDVTFVDIILTCFLESLDNYFSKTCTGSEHHKSYPNSILTLVPIMPINYNFKAYGTRNYKLDNKTLGGVLRLPLKMDANQRHVLKRLELVRKEYNVLKNESLDLMFNRWILQVLRAPSYVMKWVFDKYSTSITVSNIPGCSSLKCFGGLKVKEFVVIDPNARRSGVTLMITSYEERLTFAYTIDTAVIANVEDVKWISTNFMHNFNKLREIVNVNANERKL